MREEYKGFYITYDNPLLGYKISNVGKGQVASFLKGYYTTKDFAKQRIEAYLAFKVDKDGSTGSDG